MNLLHQFQFATPMRWGMICSIEDSKQLLDFEKFGEWMVTELEQAAHKLHLGHCFVPTPNFVMHAMPGSIEEAVNCYEKVAISHPEVLYVVHVLPSKDSLEFKLHKERTCVGALVGQAVLAENALNHFKRYELEEVMYSMNQWIARRLSQIMARPNENSKLKNKNLDNNNYRMLIRNTGGFESIGEASYNQQNQNVSKNRSQQTLNDFEHPVGVVLHKDQSSQYQYCGDQSRQSASIQQNQCQKNGCDHIVVKGFPADFNKYQIASLFPDFRPIHVEHRAVSEAIVQFANRYHAAQVLQNYDGRHFEGEDFTLTVRGEAADVQRKVLREKLNELQDEGKQ